MGRLRFRYKTFYFCCCLQERFSCFVRRNLGSKEGREKSVVMSTAKEDDVCSHMKVVVRVRPETQKEKDGNFAKVVHVVDRHILVFDPKEEEFSFFHGKKLTHRDINKRTKKDLKFVFDAVFAETSTQLEVFEHTTKSVLDGFLNGYNCTGNFDIYLFSFKSFTKFFGRSTFVSGCCSGLRDLHLNN